MNPANAEFDVDVDDIDNWFFVPYTGAVEYSDSDPLYAVVATFDDFGDVMIYDRPGDAGAFHSVDPEHTDADVYPVTDAFKNALATIMSNPGESQNVTDFIAEMHPWEHHHLEILITGANTSPELLPVETRAFINTILDEKLRMEIDDEDKVQGTWFSKLFEEEQENFLDQLQMAPPRD